MNEEELDFMSMLSVIRVIDDDDRIREFKECIESQFKMVKRKVTQYKRDGSLTITMRFVNDKKNMNTVNVYAEVTKKIPKGSQCNAFYSDQTTGGLYLDDPNQLNWLKKNNNVRPISGKDASAQNEN